MIDNGIATRPGGFDRSACQSYATGPLHSPEHDGDNDLRPFLSVIAPCYNESEGLLEFHRRVHAVCESIGKTYEIVLVNDGSRDATWAVMSKLAERHPEVVAVNLSRNFGQEKALAAGLAVCQGDIVLVIDADLQDPPELLSKMLEIMEAGADVVYGQRRSRAGDSWFKKVSASLFYRFMDRISDIPIPRDTGPFRLLRRRVVQVLLQMPEQNRYHRGLVSWAGYRQIPILFDREARHVGESQWPLGRMVSLALDAMTGFSTRPLRWAGWLAMGAMLLTLTTFAWWLEAWLIQGQAMPLLAVIWIVSGLSAGQLGVLFILGEYIGRIGEQVRNRPLFVIESVVSSGNFALRGNRELP